MVRLLLKINLTHNMMFSGFKMTRKFRSADYCTLCKSMFLEKIKFFEKNVLKISAQDEYIKKYENLLKFTQRNIAPPHSHLK